MNYAEHFETFVRTCIANLVFMFRKHLFCKMNGNFPLLYKVENFGIGNRVEIVIPTGIRVVISIPMGFFHDWVVLQSRSGSEPSFFHFFPALYGHVLAENRKVTRLFSSTLLCFIMSEGAIICRRPQCHKIF